MHLDVDVILATIGFTAIITLSWLTKPLRKFKLFKCSMCIATWIGATLYYLDNNYDIKIILYAGIGSLTSYTWFLLMKHFIDKYD